MTAKLKTPQQGAIQKAYQAARRGDVFFTALFTEAAKKHGDVPIRTLNAIKKNLKIAQRRACRGVKYGMAIHE